MRIFLPLGLALERRPDVLGGLNDLWACNVAGRSIAAVTRIDQLDCISPMYQPLGGRGRDGLR